MTTARLTESIEQHVAMKATHVYFGHNLRREKHIEQVFKDAGERIIIVESTDRPHRDIQRKTNAATVVNATLVQAQSVPH